MLKQFAALFSVVSLVGGLGACGNGDVGSVNSANRVQGNKGWDPATGSVFGEGGLNLATIGRSNPGAGSGEPGIGVNAYLWRGALDTLSFMPLASADPFGGVIITDWYTPPTSNGSGERFKATAYILGRQLRADGIRVSIFRQVLENGQWVDAAVSTTTVSEIENRVLARARELRAQGGTTAAG